MKNDSRYPYTYSADYIRHLGPKNAALEPLMSRADAAHFLTALSNTLSIPREELASKFADEFLKLESVINDVKEASKPL